MGRLTLHKCVRACVHVMPVCLSVCCDQILLIKCCHFLRCNKLMFELDGKSWVSKHTYSGLHKRNMGFCLTHTAFL